MLVAVCLPSPCNRAKAMPDSRKVNCHTTIMTPKFRKAGVWEASTNSEHSANLFPNSERRSRTPQDSTVVPSSLPLHKILQRRHKKRHNAHLSSLGVGYSINIHQSLLSIMFVACLPDGGTIGHPSGRARLSHAAHVKDGHPSTAFLSM